ncbi:MAG: glycoside hydrolase family 44 protein [Polyangiaceae bacterium]
MRKWLLLGALGATVLVVAALWLRVRQVAQRAAALQAAALTELTPSAFPASIEIAEVAYDGGLGPGWQDWSVGLHELSNSGPAKVVFAAHGGVVLHHTELRATYGGISFRYKAPSGWPQFLAVNLKRGGSPDSAFPRVALRAENVKELADGWHHAFVAWDQLNPERLAVDRIAISATSTVAGDWVLLDKVVLTRSLAEGSAAAPSRGVGLKIRCDVTPRLISPQIYGGAGGDWDSGQTAERIGGNLTSRMNWDAGNLWNAGNDWFFENGHSNGTIWEWLDGSARRGAPAALTVPMIGWVSKDDSSVGFPKSKFPKQRKFDKGRPQAGDGFDADGAPIAPGPPSQTSMPAPPQMIGRWIRTLREKDRQRGSRSAGMYILDNEPSLWNATHRDVHPQPLTQDELLQRTIDYATEIRNADPEGKIAGPAEWGWRGYFYSGKDQALAPSLRPDRLAHGDVPVIPWYLAKLAEYERTNHVTLLDILDVHFYPAADGLYGSNARTDPEGAALRIRSTRALWDNNYRDESWINEPIGLIPRLKRWVADNYPGRQVSIGEWSFGADAHISGGLATAEALGRFGQQGLDSAFYWDGPKAKTATFWAFRAFRNFDGKGGRFLDFSLPTRESDKVSLFASRDAAGKHIVAILVNRDATFAVNADLELETCGTATTRRIFAYGAGSSELTEQRDPAAADPRAPVVLAPYSITVVDLSVTPL